MDVFFPSLARARRCVELLLAAEEATARHPAVVEDDLGRVRGADAHLLELLTLGDARRSLGHHEAGLAAAPERRIDGEHQDVGVGDAAVGDPGLRAVEDPLVLRLVVDRTGLQRGDVRPRVGLGDPERGELDVVGRPEALRDPFADLLGRPVGEDPGHGQGRAEDGQPDAGVAPAHLLVDQAHEEAGRVREALRDEVEGVEPVLGRLLNDRPGRLLALVPLGAGGTDDVLSELVDPLDDLQLVLVQLEGEVRHCCALLAWPRPRPEPVRLDGAAPAIARHARRVEPEGPLVTAQ